MRDNKSAFPMYEMGEPGMTLRDWFAGQVLAGETANPDSGLWDESHKYETMIKRAQLYYRIADAMLEARK